jgi:hypothetical protein
MAFIEESTDAKSPKAAPVLRTYVRSKKSSRIVRDWWTSIVRVMIPLVHWSRKRTASDTAR